MSLKKINIIFRKPAPQFNSIETVFNAILPHIEKEFEVNKVYLPYRTTGISAMQKNIRYVEDMNLNGPVHISGHENYIIHACKEKTILTLHDIGSATVGKPIRDFFIKRNWFMKPMRKADVVTVISKYSGDEISLQYPFSKDKINVVSNPVDDAITYTPSEFSTEKPVILQVGTKENKNLETTIDAIEGIRCRMIILGQLTLDQKEKLSVQGIEYENMFHIPYAEVIELYKRCDMLSFASLYEGFGMPILEAQATGRPVITSNRTAMPGTAGEGAAIVDPLDKYSIRDAVMRIIQDREYRDDLVKKGLDNVASFSAERIAKDYMDIYSELL